MSEVQGDSFCQRRRPRARRGSQPGHDARRGAYATLTIDLPAQEIRGPDGGMVKFEIDQARQFRAEGQTIDAILQLTEAEKISRALGMQESAQAIRDMMEGVRGQS